MSVYTVVYSPDNEFFEVTRDVADTLILEYGWTQSPVVIETKKDKKEVAPLDIDEDM